MRNKVCVSIALVLSLQVPVWASLVAPRFQAIDVYEGRVVLQYETELLFFDLEGHFVESKSFLLEPPYEWTLVGVLADGRYVFLRKVRGEDFRVVSTELRVYDSAGALAAEHDFDGNRSVRVAADRALYVSRIDEQTLTVERLDPDAGVQEPYAEIFLSEPAYSERVRWAVGSNGELVVLLQSNGGGTVSRYASDGVLLHQWTVEPDPFTSVAYIEDVSVDATNRIYVTHSSWEASTSTENAGSVLSFEPDGTPRHHIKDDIGYLQAIAVADDGSIFLFSLSDRVTKYSSNGERQRRWIGEPPRFGESWEERERLVAAVEDVGPEAPISDLVLALVYDVSFDVYSELTKRGADALPELARAAVRYEAAWSMPSLLGRLVENHPDIAVSIFESESHAVRRVLARHLAYTDRPPPAGLRDVLEELVAEGDDRAEWALEQVLPVEDRITRFVESARRGFAENEHVGAYELRREYAEAQETLAAILADPSDPDRRRFREVVLEASLELAKQDELPDAVTERTEAWLESDDPFVADAGAIAITAFGVPNHLRRVLVAVERSPELLDYALRAMERLAETDPEPVDEIAEALVQLAYQAPESLSALARIGTPRVTTLTASVLRDDRLPLERRAQALDDLVVDALPRAALLELLGDDALHQEMAEEYGFYSFLGQVGEAFTSEDDVVAPLKKILYRSLVDRERLPVPEPDPENPIWAYEDLRGDVLDALAPVFDASDVPKLLSLLDDRELPGSARYRIVGLVGGVELTSESKARLEALLEEPDFALPAAEALGRIGHPGALEVLIEEGLQKAGLYSNVSLDAESLRPYGREAEDALLSLMDYANRQTQHDVRRLLGELSSEEGVRRMQAELAESFAAESLPESGTLAGLIAAGIDPLPELIDFLTSHPDEIERYYGPPECDGMTSYVEPILIQETDPRRATVMAGLLRKKCYDEAEAVLAEIRERNPSAAVRDALEPR